MSARGACASLLARTTVIVPLKSLGSRGFGSVRQQFQHLQHGRPSASLLLALHSNGRALNATQRAFLSAQAGAGNGAAAGDAGKQQAGGSGSGKEGEAKADEIPFDEYEVQEPLVARASRLVWTTIKLTAGVAFLGTLVYAGYTIVTTLLPVGSSPNAIMRKATDIIVHDPDVHAYYGNCKTYGMDPGGKAEGRRYFVPEYKYDDTLTGDKYHRVKFNLEGERNRKATVFAEVSESTGDFRYLIVVAKDGSRVVSVIDRRPPPMSTEERMSRVTSLIQDAGWAFYADNELDAREQARVLGEYWLKVKCVRCDEQAERCAEAGVAQPPAWKTTTSGVVKGVKSVEDLERMVQPLAKAKEGKSSKGFFG